MRALFIYWKVAPDDLAGALAAARAFQAGLPQRHPSLAAGLYQRAESGAVVVTLMETYTQLGGLNPAVALEIVQEAQAALGSWCKGLRHVETFEHLQP